MSRKKTDINPKQSASGLTVIRDGGRALAFDAAKGNAEAKRKVEARNPTRAHAKPWKRPSLDDPEARKKQKERSDAAENRFKRRHEAQARKLSPQQEQKAKAREQESAKMILDVEHAAAINEDQDRAAGFFEPVRTPVEEAETEYLAATGKHPPKPHPRKDPEEKWQELKLPVQWGNHRYQVFYRPIRRDDGRVFHQISYPIDMPARALRKAHSLASRHFEKYSGLISMKDQTDIERRFKSDATAIPDSNDSTEIAKGVERATKRYTQAQRKKSMNLKTAKAIADSEKSGPPSGSRTLTQCQRRKLPGLFEKHGGNAVTIAKALRPEETINGNDSFVVDVRREIKRQHLRSI